MNTKEWLSRAKGVESRIAALEREQESAFSKADYISPDFKEKVQTSYDNGTEIKYMSYLDYVDKIEIEKGRLRSIRTEIRQAINTLDSNEDIALLIDSLIVGLTDEELALIHGYSVDYVGKKINTLINKINISENIRKCP